MSWSAKQYLAFEDERTRPVRDLIGATPASDPRKIVDLGCGPGNSTEVLKARFPRAAVNGIDASADMIAAARMRLPQIDFEVADIAAWAAPGPFDLLFANAALHWIGDHASLLPNLIAKLRPGGSLAIQMPDNVAEPAIALMRVVAERSRWRQRLADADRARMNVKKAEWYYALLRPLCARVDLWRTIYFHQLAGPQAIVEWFKGSGLRPFLDLLAPSEQIEFLKGYRAAVAEAYPAQSDGTVLLPFPRLFIVAMK